MDIVSNLEEIEALWAKCTRCDLHKERNKVVIGNGNCKATVLLIGEAPGKEEDAAGIPFVGQSGDLLRYTVEKVLNLTWEDLFITNIVGCRPPENRNPTPDEIACCWPRVAQIIYTIDPIIIVTLGAVPMRAMIRGKSRSITEARGEIVPVSFKGRYIDYSIAVLPTFHPAYALRVGRQDSDSPLFKMGEDLLLAHEIAEAIEGKF